MAEAMTKEATPKKVAFVSKPYSQEDRRKKDEEELNELIKEQKKDAESNTVEPEEIEPTSAEEKTFKKRYGDLRRHSQEKEKEFQKQLNELKNQLSDATKKEMKLPKSDDDIEKWAAEYPDVAQIVETIAMKKAAEQNKDIEERLNALSEKERLTSRERAEMELLQIHPDFVEIRDNPDFHAWAEEQPEYIQSALYENEDDPKAASRAIDLYKADIGVSKKKKPSKKDAAKAVNTKGSTTTPDSKSSDADTILESDVAKMSAVEYEKNEEAIRKAVQTGKFVYDVSGAARA